MRLMNCLGHTKLVSTSTVSINVNILLISPSRTVQRYYERISESQSEEAARRSVHNNRISRFQKLLLALNLAEISD